MLFNELFWRRQRLTNNFSRRVQHPFGEEVDSQMRGRNARAVEDLLHVVLAGIRSAMHSRRSNVGADAVTKDCR